jgi:hypothetical protein
MDSVFVMNHRIHYLNFSQLHGKIQISTSNSTSIFRSIGHIPYACLDKIDRRMPLLMHQVLHSIDRVFDMHS